MPIEKLVLPVGRIVWGNPMKPQVQRNYQTKQPVIKNGVEVIEWSCGVAIPKAQLGNIMNLINQEVATLYKNGVSEQFSWKIVDGDGLDKKRNPYSNREGYAGHYVFKISTIAFAPPIYKYENGAYRKIEAHELKTGDYVSVCVDIKAHTDGVGGLYINPHAFTLVGYGSEIVSSSSDPNEMFKGQDFSSQLPQGASLTPSFGNVPAAPSFGNVPAAPSFGNVPAGMPAPAHDFVNQFAGQQTQQNFTAPNQVAVNQPQFSAQPTGGSTAAPVTSFPTR